jgi:N-formylglutamate amidohydrolase
VDATLRRRGYSVVRNKPYAGGFITEHYGEPALGRHALQIEINRAIYMDERSLAKKPRFTTLQRDLEEVFTLVTQEAGADLTPRRIAAE